MDAEKGEKSGPSKKRNWVPPKRKTRSIYSHHNCNGSQKGTDAKAPNTDNATPTTAEDTNDFELEITGNSLDGSLEAVDSIA